MTARMLSLERPQQAWHKLKQLQCLCVAYIMGLLYITQSSLLIHIDNEVLDVYEVCSLLKSLDSFFKGANTVRHINMSCHFPDYSQKEIKCCLYFIV